MWPWRRSVDSEKLLLKRCFDGDAEAQQDFATNSYVGTIQRAVRLTLAGDYSPDHVESVATLCTFHIYQFWDDLPSATEDLHTSIRKVATAFAINYRKRDLQARRS